MKRLRPSLAALRVTLGVLPLMLLLPSCSKVKSWVSGEAGGSGATPAGASQAAASLSNFEGELGVVFKPGAQARDTKVVGPINLQVKNGKIRLDAPTDVEQLKGIGRAYLVIAALDKKIFAVLEDKKEVVLLDLDKLGAQLKSMVPATARDHEPPKVPENTQKITKTGHKDKVAGHDCEDWEIATERGKAVICVAERGVPWLKLPTLSVPSEHAWLSELLDGQHFPLRLIAQEKDGQESGRIEVTKLEAKTLPAQLFELPQGYRTVELQQAIQELMMAGMGGHAMPPGGPGQLPPDIAARLNAARKQAAAAKAK